MNWKLTSIAICALLLGGCTAGVEPTRTGPEDPMDPVMDPTDPPTDPIPDPTPRPTACAPGDSYLFVIDFMDLGRPDPDGDPSVVAGFDLDGLASDGSDASSCHQTDWADGVDNALGPAISDVPGVDVTRDLERAVQRGELILLVRVSGVEDLFDDDCVDIDVLFGLMPEDMSAPEMTTTDRFTPDQTFDVSRQTLFTDGRPRFTIRGASIAAGRIETKNEDDVPFQIPTPDGELVELTLSEPHISADVTANGITNGRLGGRVDATEVTDALAAVADPVLVNALITGIADLDPDDRGLCQSVSVGVVYEGVSAVEGVIR